MTRKELNKRLRECWGVVVWVNLYGDTGRWIRISKTDITKFLGSSKDDKSRYVAKVHIGGVSHPRSGQLGPPDPMGGWYVKEWLCLGEPV